MDLWVYFYDNRFKVTSMFIIDPPQSLSVIQQLKNIWQLPAEMWLVLNFFHVNTDVLTFNHSGSTLKFYWSPEDSKVTPKLACRLIVERWILYVDRSSSPFHISGPFRLVGWFWVSLKSASFWRKQQKWQDPKVSSSNIPVISERMIKSAWWVSLIKKNNKRKGALVQTSIMREMMAVRVHVSTLIY